MPDDVLASSRLSQVVGTGEAAITNLPLDKYLGEITPANNTR